MVQHLTTTPEQITFVQSTSARDYAANRHSIAGGQGQDNSFRLFGKDGFTFWDLIDIINPLQHIPVISSIYRSITGDHIDPGSRVFGGALFGGPIGAGVQVVNAVVEHQTGRDFGEHAIAMFTGDDPADGQPQAVPNEVAALKNQFRNPDLSGPFISGFAGPPIAPEPITAPFTALGASPRAGRHDAAGMSAIPIANGNFAFEDRAAAYMGSTTPDLGLLDAKPKSRAGNQPIQLTPRYPLNDETPAPKVETSRLRNAPSAARKIAALERSMNDAKTSWVIESMMRGLDKYQAGKRLSADVTGRQVSVLR